jgi:hypothetical protein
MKKTIISLIVVLFAMGTLVQAQTHNDSSAREQKDVTKFLGIPVDGSKYEMMQKLKAKGFTSTSFDKDILEGEFNGTDVYLGVATNNNKVWRIYVYDKNTMDEGQIKIRFNNLCQQFENNEKYTTIDNCAISDDEDISYEMLVNKKEYNAMYPQMPSFRDTVAFREDLNRFLLSKYTEEQISILTQEEIEDILIKHFMAGGLNKRVWFTIAEDKNYGEYRIVMYYDNTYNEANGEDL